LHVKETDRWIAPNYFRQEGELPAGTILAYWDGQQGWFGSTRETSILTGARLKQVEGDVFRVYFRLLLSDRIEGRTVSAPDDDTLEISDASGHIVRVIVSPEGLPVTLLYTSPNANGPDVPMEEDYSDFREVSGIKIPFIVKLTQGGQKFADVTITDFRVNTGLKVQDLGKRP
jgi:hypothetical protein